MKITQSKLKQIIKEEIEAVLLNENFMDKLKTYGSSLANMEPIKGLVAFEDFKKNPAVQDVARRAKAMHDELQALLSLEGAAKIAARAKAIYGSPELKAFETQAKKLQKQLHAKGDLTDEQLDISRNLTRTPRSFIDLLDQLMSVEPGYNDSYSNFSKILKNDVQNVLFSLEAASEVSPRRRKS
tara:strand:+ start:2379 stop:2930 length:552 start_codon:yes stop_codon:yes gene_type:complete